MIVKAKQTAAVVEMLYKRGDLSVNEIARNQNISKATLYRYLRHQDIKVGSFKKASPALDPKSLKVSVHLVVENNSKLVRGKSKSRKDIEELVFYAYNMKKLDKKGYD